MRLLRGDREETETDEGGAETTADEGKDFFCRIDEEAEEEEEEKGEEEEEDKSSSDFRSV
jgi:hypothetical protein